MSHVNGRQFRALYNQHTEYRYGKFASDFELLASDDLVEFNELTNILDKSRDDDKIQVAYEMLEAFFPEETKAIAKPQPSILHSLWTAPEALSNYLYDNLEPALTSVAEEIEEAWDGASFESDKTNEPEQAMTAGQGAHTAVPVEDTAVHEPARQKLEPYTVKGRRLYRGDEAITLSGVNWFGFETADLGVHGLWSQSSDDMITKIKSMGFNAVRLPLSSATLKNKEILSSYRWPHWDLPRTSLDAYDGLMQKLDAHDVYVVVDYHSIEPGKREPLWTTDQFTEADWIRDLSFIAKRYANNPHFVGIDLYNEPRGDAHWAQGEQATDWKRAAEAAAAQVIKDNPNVLVFVQGVSNSQGCDTQVKPVFWGENLSREACAPLAIPHDKLVLSPHVYGPDVSRQPYFLSKKFPDNLPSVWDEHFGSLVDAGRAVVPGEFGGHYGEDARPRETLWQKAFISYLSQKEICDSFYWALNPNSADTGGLLKDDWRSVDEEKLALLRAYNLSCQGRAK